MRLSPQMEAEFDRLRREDSAVNHLITKIIAFEAAMIVLARHKLMVEFADEISALKVATDTGSVT